MKPVLIVLAVIAAIAIIGMIVLYFVGKKLQSKQDASEAQMKAAAQTFPILVIDKKRMRLKDANLPKMVLDQTPKYLRASKVPIVKAKIGPKVMTLMCDNKIFDLIPLKKEVKAVISGIYIMEVKGLRGALDPVKKEKKGLFKRFKKNN